VSMNVDGRMINRSRNSFPRGSFVSAAVCCRCVM